VHASRPGDLQQGVVVCQQDALGDERPQGGQDARQDRLTADLEQGLVAPAQARR
jgi:hypothetical protein